MIHRTLARKYIEQSSLLWLGCAITLFGFCWLRVWVVSLLDMGRFQIILEQFREYERFSPVGFDQLFTYAGRIGMTFDEPVVIFCVVVWCVSRGSDVVSGELSRGTLEMLLAQPLSRTRLLVTNTVVSVAGLAGLALLVWAGIWVGVQVTTVEETVPPPSLYVPWVGLNLPLSWEAPETVLVSMRDQVDCRVYVGSTANLFAFGCFILGLSTLMSSWDRYRWRTIGIVMAIYVFQLVIFGLGKAAEQLDWLTHLSFFDLYRPQVIAKDATDHGAVSVWSLVPLGDEYLLGPFAYTLALLALGAICLGLAARIFAKRDLPSPL